MSTNTIAVILHALSHFQIILSYTQIQQKNLVYGPYEQYETHQRDQLFTLATASWIIIY